MPRVARDLGPTCLVWASVLCLVLFSTLPGALAQPPPPNLPFASTIVFGNAASPPATSPPPPPPAPIPPSEITGFGWTDGRSPSPPPPAVTSSPPPASSPPVPPPVASVQAGSAQKGPATGSSGLSGGAIGGIVGGVLAGVLVLVAIGIVVFLRRRHARFQMLSAESSGFSDNQGKKPYNKQSGGWGSMSHSDSSNVSRKPGDSVKDLESSLYNESEQSGGKSGLSWITDRGPTTPKTMSAVKLESSGDPPAQTELAMLSEPLPHLERDESLGRMTSLSAREQGHDSDSYIRPMPDGSHMVVTRGVEGSLKVMRGPASNVSTRSAGATSMNSSGTEDTITGTHTSSVLPELPWSDWELRPEDVQICKRPDGSLWNLGSGAFGTVYRAMLDGVQEVAVKQFHDSHDVSQLDDVLREVAILKGCRNRNIVQFLGACIQSNRIQLVTEFMEAGDLWHALIAFRSSGALAWYKRGQRIALEVTRGLNYLHKRKICHFDLKSANILLTRDGTAKISDVGFANILSKTHLTNNAAFTFAWAAPEVLLGMPCTLKADIYSLGVVLWELATGGQPKRGMMRACRVPEECPPEVEKLINRCIDSEPANRPSTKDIVEVLQQAQQTKP